MPPAPDPTRRAHGVVAVLTLAALVLQLVLVVQDAGILIEQDARPGLGIRLARFFSYFTIQANLLVLVVSAAVARGADVERPVWQAVRLTALTGIVVTAAVHWVALRPLLDLSGGPRVADTLLHVAVPVAAVTAWVAAGPHGLGGWRRVAAALLWPTAWAAFTLVRGAITGWYPYPFIDVRDLGAGRVSANVVVIALLFGAVAAAVLAVDRRLAQRHAQVAGRQPDP